MGNSRVTVHLTPEVDTDPLAVWHTDGNVSIRIQEGIMDVDVWVQGTLEQLERFVIDLDVEIHAAFDRRREALRDVAAAPA